MEAPTACHEVYSPFEPYGSDQYEEYSKWKDYILSLYDDERSSDSDVGNESEHNVSETGVDNDSNTESGS